MHKKEEREAALSLLQEEGRQRPGKLRKHLCVPWEVRGPREPKQVWRRQKRRYRGRGCPDTRYPKPGTVRELLVSEHKSGWAPEPGGVSTARGSGTA